MGEKSREPSPDPSLLPPSVLLSVGPHRSFFLPPTIPSQSSHRSSRHPVQRQQQEPIRFHHSRSRDRKGGREAKEGDGRAFPPTSRLMTSFPCARVHVIFYFINLRDIVPSGCAYAILLFITWTELLGCVVDGAFGARGSTFGCSICVYNFVRPVWFDLDNTKISISQEDQRQRGCGKATQREILPRERSEREEVCNRM